MAGMPKMAPKQILNGIWQGCHVVTGEIAERNRVFCLQCPVELQTWPEWDPHLTQARGGR